MALLTKEELIAYWNSFIQKWAKDPEGHFNSKENVFKGFNHISFDPFALPEPYFGNPDRNSAVILNYNPGPVMAEYQLYPDGVFMTQGKAHEDYHAFAKPFPYLADYTSNSGGNWWLKRKEWVNRLALYATPDVQLYQSELLPFALEICPWHSRSFNLGQRHISYLKGYITNFVLDPAEEIAKNSLLPFIVSVGKDYQDLFQFLGFKMEYAISPTNYSQYGLQYPLASNKPVMRHYSVWRSPQGGLYLNTYSQGSNLNPSTAFGDVERFIVDKLTSMAGLTHPLPANSIPQNYIAELPSPKPKT